MNSGNILVDKKKQNKKTKKKIIGGNTMSIKLNRSANQVIKKKVWRDKQLKAIESDLNRLEDTIRDNWDTIGYVDREVLCSAHDYIEKYLNNRDKRVVALKDWIQEIDALADERASFSSCLKQIEKN